MTLHPQIIEKDGRKEFVVLSYDEYLKVRDALEDLDDIKALRQAKEETKDEPRRSLEEIKKRFGVA